MEFGGDDWESLTSKHNSTRSTSKVFDEVHEFGLVNKEKERLLDALKASSDANGKVKIKISKKELAVLLGETEKKGHASAEQVLARLINAKEQHDVHHRPWKPALQSIPEVN